MSGPLIYYVRHGQTDWNAELRFQGRIDIPLNTIGREQAHGNGKRLSALLGKAEDFIFISSPLSRSRETMEIIRFEMGLPAENYATDERLIEMSYGDLEGTTQAEFKASDRELYYQRKSNHWAFQPTNGESHNEVLQRVKQWYADLDPEAKYIVTAHGAVGRVVRHYLAGIDVNEVCKTAFPQDKVFCFKDGREELI